MQVTGRVDGVWKIAGNSERSRCRRRWRAALGVVCLVLVAPLPTSAQHAITDPGFWVILPDGGLVPFNHPLAIAAGKRARPAPPERPAQSPPSPQPVVRILTTTDPGFWVTLPDGGMVPYNHPLALAAGTGARPVSQVRPAPSPPSPQPVDRNLTTTDPGFWVTLANGGMVPYNHPLALAAGNGAHPARPAPSPSSPQPADRILTTTDPGFWVTLPDGGMVPYNHPLALAAAVRTSTTLTSTRSSSSSSTSSSTASSTSSPQQPQPQPQPAPSPAPAPQPSAPASASAVKVLTWNIQHGVGTDGSYDLDRLAAWIAKSGANVVSLNEVERFTGWGNEDQPARFASLLKSRTGRTWHYRFAERNGGTRGQGNLLLTTFPIESAGEHQLSYSRSVARIALVVDGQRVNVFSTHLDAESSARRATQMRELTRWAETYPEQRIVAGDFNAWPGAAEVSNMTSTHDDTWAVAAAQGTAVAFAGNEKGNTRNSRIDYVFRSKAATRLRLDGVRVLDTRDSRGHMPSDHRPVIATFTVR